MPYRAAISVVVKVPGESDEGFSAVEAKLNLDGLAKLEDGLITSMSAAGIGGGTLRLALRLNSSERLCPGLTPLGTEEGASCVPPSVFATYGPIVLKVAGAGAVLAIIVGVGLFVMSKVKATKAKRYGNQGNSGPIDHSRVGAGVEMAPYRPGGEA